MTQERRTALYFSLNLLIHEASLVETCSINSVMRSPRE